MKIFKILGVALTLATSTNTIGQIQFKENVPFQTVLDQAKKENKLVFIDCYTTWCGPCKYLSKNVFSDAELGNTYNSQFVNFKSDMEKGEGLEIAKKYDINAYPTLLWLDGEGEVVYQIVGAYAKEDFMKIANDVKVSENTLPAMLKRYESGNRDTEFLHKLATTASMSGIPHADVYATEYLKTIPKENWLLKDNLSFVYTAATSFDSEVTQYVLAHKTELNAENLTLFDAIIDNCLNTELTKAIDTGSEKELQDLLKKIDQYAPEKSAEKQAIELRYYSMTGNRAKLNELTSKYLKDSKDPWLLNSYAWDRFENETDEKLLKEAIVWAERSVKMEKDYANTDTLGQLYKKIGNEKKAAKWLAVSKKLEPKE